VRHAVIPDTDFVGALVGNGFPSEYAAILIGLFGAARTGYAAQLSSAVEQITGRRPTTFADFVRASADAWREASVSVGRASRASSA
jgi:hypothetical protein